MYFPLHPETPTQGRALTDLFGAGADIEAMHERMAGLMRSEGLPYGRRTHTYNSRLAQELARWGDEVAPAADLHDALYRAYFVEGRNLADPETLVACAAGVGLPADEARRVLVERTYRAAVDQDWADAARSGVTAVPTFEAGGAVVVGAQPETTLEALVRSAGAEPRGPAGA